jgi:tRNA (cmo5U34)-methyltransferase
VADQGEIERIDDRFKELYENIKEKVGPKNDNPPLREFFNQTAEVWDEKFGRNAASFYAGVAANIRETNERIEILYLGCGTGMQLASVFLRAPNARITGIDLADVAMERLKGKYPERINQIELIQGNYLNVPFGERVFDYATSTLTMHHLPPDSKVVVYRNVLKALKTGGCYIEGDQCALEESAKRGLDFYEEHIKPLPDGDRAGWNYDITLTASMNARSLVEAGFTTFSLPRKRVKGCNTILVAWGPPAGSTEL